VKRDRVLGWDVLRGLCALAVASYHLLAWQDVATLHTFGSYGVYLFFVLSGASLAYNYQGLIDGPPAVLRFLAVRWLRLAPLFVAIGALFVLL
jgi:peptidoglycan/LPS O-acetylase OafA/YrhL